MTLGSYGLVYTGPTTRRGESISLIGLILQGEPEIEPGRRASLTMNEHTDNMAAISAAFASMADAAAQFIEACQQAWDTISEIVADALQSIGRIWRKWCAAHLIPRQYRDTMMRRKIRLMYRN